MDGNPVAISDRHGVVDVLRRDYGAHLSASPKAFADVSLAFFLSTVFSVLWPPLLIVLCGAVVMSLIQYVPGLSRFNLFEVMSAEPYFRGGELPWFGLLTSMAMSAAVLYLAARNIARQD